MSKDWLNTFDVSIAEFQQAVDGACRGPGMRHADEILDEVLVLLASIVPQDPGKFPSKHKLLGFAYTTAKRMLWRLHRKDRRLQTIDPFNLDEYAAAAKESEAFPSRQELLDALEGAALEIREVFRLHLEGLEGQAIAGELGMSESTTSRRLNAAREILRLKFGDLFDPWK